MIDPRPELSETYRDMSDEELVERWSEGHLTDVAKDVAQAEFVRRGMSLPDYGGDDEDDADDLAEEGAAGETVVFETVARSLIPSDLHILQARLSAEGIPAFVVDDNITRMNSLWSVALGGARLLVPQPFAAEAKRFIGYVRSGRFRLRDGDDLS